VWMAEQEVPVRRRVALKVIKPGMDTKQVLARFDSERQALAMMDHPSIARVFDGGATDTGRPYFVMELVRGTRITDYCDANKLSMRERLLLFMQVCQAVQHAHQKGIIHRDLKPSNILVTEVNGAPVPKVIDFGVAKATQARLTEKTLFTGLHQMIGTPAYMSPEQAGLGALDIDTRSDIYALGVLLYELLTGQTPITKEDFEQAGMDEIFRLIREQDPPKPSTRLSALTREKLTDLAARRQAEPFKLNRLFCGDLDWIVMKALEKDRRRRYETANGLAMDLERHLENEPVFARPPSAAYRLQKSWRRNKTAFSAAALIALVLVAATTISVWQAVRATRAEALAAGRLIESDNSRKEAEAISKFLTEVFQSPDPARDGRTITVAETLGAASMKLDTDLADQPLRRAKLQATLGSTYFALGLYRDAIPLQERVRDRYMADLGPEHPDMLKAMNSLANSYQRAGRGDEALKLREQLLPLCRKVKGPDHPDTLKAQHNLATSYDEAGRHDEALKLREEMLPLFRKVFGPEDQHTLGAMQNLAISYDQAGRRDDALKLREDALSLYRRVSRPESPATLLAMNNLGHSYENADRNEEALKLFEEVVAVQRKISGPEHPDTLRAMKNLAITYEKTGRLDESLKLEENVLALSRKVNGPEHPDTLNVMNALAWSLATSDAPRIRNGTNALELAQGIVAATHRKNAAFLDTLAAALAESGQFDKAAAVQQEALGLPRSDQEKVGCDYRLKLYQAGKPYHRLAKP
jgi:tetratricopeptide (TPR) repeat protein/tRNA A-37 threonylcarbamoyl transferase component Bud32